MGFHGVPGTQSSIPSKREKRVPEEAQAAGGWSSELRLGGRTQGAAGSPPSRISSAGYGPTLVCAHPAEKLRALTGATVCTALTPREL